MEDKLQQIIEKLDKSLQQSADGNDARFQAAFSYSFIDPDNTPDRQLKTLKEPLEGVEAILQLIERYPDIHYFYEPDYLCLYLEHYYGKGYETLLLQSVRRCPIAYTLHLLHRVINDTTNPHRPAALDLLRHAAQNTDYPEAIRKDAAERVSHIEEQERPLAVQPANYQVISLQEAIQRFDLETLNLREEDKNATFKPDTLEDTYTDDPLVIVFEGDTELEEEVHLSYEMLRSLTEFNTPPISDFHKLLLGGKANQDRILIINGNLKAPKIDMSSINCLFVFGNAHCHKFKFHEARLTWIQGNLHATEAILGSASSDDDCFLEAKGAYCARVQGTAYAPRVQTWYMRLGHLDHEQHLTDDIW